MEKIKELCQLPHPYRDYYSMRIQDLFVAAMRENLEWHLERNSFFRDYLESKGWHWQQGGPLEEIPFIIAKFFKKHQSLSIPEREVFLHLTSSGTMGEKSQVFFDEWSIRSAQAMVDRIFEHYGWVTREQSVNYLLYSYESSENASLGTAYTDNFLCSYAPMKAGFVAIKGNNFDWSGTLRFLEESASSGIPVRIFGFPSFLYFTLKKMRELKRPKLKLHPDSLVFLGGGWKNYSGESISKAQLYQQVQEWLGILDHRLRDGFGSVEHCIPYVECEHHHFHVPVWSRVFIRDVRTLAVLPEGEKGFLQLMSPYITSMPAMNVLMSDLASLHHPSECGCQAGTPYFVIHGRAGLTSNRSCAIAASELLKGA